jgi:hypothetical protein
MMLSGGIIEAGGGHPGAVSAYVVYSAGRESRLFKVKGSSSTPTVTELAAATTIDLKRFQTELAEDLAPTLSELEKVGAAAAVATPSGPWVCDVVRAHLKNTEGLDVT